MLLAVHRITRGEETDNVRQIMARRERQAFFRLILLAVMLLFFQAYTLPGVMVWVAFAYVAIQIWESAGLPRLLVMKVRPAFYENVALSTICISAFVFGAPAMIWGFHSGLLGLLCGAYLLSGCILNSLLMTKGCRRAFVASVGPFLVYIVSSGVLIVGSRWGTEAMVKVAIASGAMSMSAVKLWIDSSRARQVETATLADLGRREAELASAVKAADAANRAKSEFLANMSHEIRTPLNGVIAVADMLTRRQLDPKAQEMAEIIRSSGDTLQRLLSDILDVSRIEAGQVAIETAPFHAGDMIRAVAGLSQLKCDEKAVRLIISIDPSIDQMVVGDLVRVRQILSNLLSNAVKFTETGQVRLMATRLEDGRAQFTVSDTGLGFPMTEKAKVLGRFQQADSSITRRFGGTGLGLSICCDLARLMGGLVDCESEPDVGSRFWLELPLPASGAQAPLHDATADATLREEAASLRVLMADDHATNRKVVELMLAGSDVSLSTVEDGSEALIYFNRQPFDLILMDMQMPVMDGLTALREIRRVELAGALPRTPVVVLSANALPEHVASAMAAGADLHLAKPFTVAALFEAMNAAINLQVRDTPQVRSAA